MGRLVVAFHKESWPLRAPFRFAGHTIESSDVVVVALSDGEVNGRGEAGETTGNVCAQIASPADRLAGGMGCEEMRPALPADGARNAVDRAL
jgi:hypothetical protein